MKNRLFSSIFIFIIILSLIFTVFCPAVYGYTPSSFTVSAEAGLLISLDGNSVIYENNANRKMYPAALVKIMTAALIADMSPDLQNEQVPVTETALASLIGKSYNAYGFTAGETLTPEQLISAIMLASSNEAAVIAAEYYGGGDTENFVSLMNAKADELGMADTNYTNVTGFHDDDQYTTANDLFKLIKHAYQNDKFKELVNTRLYTMEGTQQHPDKRYILTSNLIQDTATDYYYRYITGLKNGSSDQSGRCLAATAVKDKKTYVCILLNSPMTGRDGKDVHYEYTDAKNLFEWAFNDFQHKSVLKTDAPVCEAKIKYSSDTDHVTLYPAKELSATIPKTADNSTIQINPVLNSEEFYAPITKGDVMGYATVSYAGVELGRVDLIASESVERSFFSAAVGEIGKFLMTPWALLIIAALAAVIIGRIIAVRINRKRRKAQRVKDYRRM